MNMFNQTQVHFRPNRNFEINTLQSAKKSAAVSKSKGRKSYLSAHSATMDIDPDSSLAPLMLDARKQSQKVPFLPQTARQMSFL
jgi:hypothetical protein